VALDSVPLDAITEVSLAALITDEVVESRRLEFKQLVESGDEARREFLADVSSLANAAGGDLVVGVAETDGIATSLAGIDSGAVDAEMQRLENMLRDGIDPRIPGVALRPIAIANGAQAVIVIRVARSWAAPHMVTFKGLSRFYSRNSSGKYQLDVGELRAAFVASESARSAVRSFRVERLARISEGETPVPLIDAPKVVLHVIPLTVADAGVSVDLNPLHNGKHDSFRPIRPTSRGWNWRVNFDGVVVYEPGANDEPAWSYVQAFRSGAIEAVDPYMLRPRSEIEGQIPSGAFERALINGLEQALAIARDLGASPPVVSAVSLLGVRGYTMYLDPRRFTSGATIDRDDLLVPETLIENLDQPADRVMQPQLDAIWNAAGYAGSPNFDEAGKWNAE
jgi:hypothetical protein